MDDHPDNITENDDDLGRYRSASIDTGRLCTRPLYRFLKEYNQTIQFFFFTIGLATRADDARLVAAKALATAVADPDSTDLYNELLKNPTPIFDKMKTYSEVQSQNLILRTCNAFLLYYSEIIQLAILKKPEILKSRQTIRWDELLGFTRFDELVRYLIDKKVNELSYAGLGQMEEFMLERLGIEGALTDHQRAMASIFVEIRNIYTHNRGIVNGIFLSRVKDHLGFDFKEGKYFHVDFEIFIRIISICLESSYAIDDAVSGKFRLKRNRYEVWKSGTAKKQRK